MAQKPRMNKGDQVKTGDVFDDLGFSLEEAAGLRIKARILSALQDRIRRQRYTQAQLVDLLEDYQPNISNLVNGKISKMSIEKLLAYAHRLNLQAEITMKRKPRPSGSKKSRVA